MFHIYELNNDNKTLTIKKTIKIPINDLFCTQLKFNIRHLDDFVSKDTPSVPLISSLEAFRDSYYQIYFRKSRLKKVQKFQRNSIRYHKITL